MTEKHIPTIDISNYSDLPKPEKLAISAEVDKICRDLGFFVVKSNTVNQRLLDEIFLNLDEFFSLPIYVKDQLRTDIQPCSHQRDGYSRLLEENAHAFMGRKNLPSDYVEKYSFGRRILDDNAALPFTDDAFGKHLRKLTSSYFKACQSLSANIMEIFALALNLPLQYFQDKTDHSYDFLRLQRYPAFKDSFKNHQGIGAHTDGTLLTILTQTGPGLEVKCPDGDWIRVGNIGSDKFIVNIGDIMMRWSNDEWVSTQHRVVLTNQPRKSIVFFKLINDEAVIKTFPKFLKNGTSKYKDIEYKSYVDKKMSDLMNNNVEEQ